MLLLSPLIAVTVIFGDTSILIHLCHPHYHHCSIHTPTTIAIHTSGADQVKPHPKSHQRTRTMNHARNALSSTRAEGKTWKCSGVDSSPLCFSSAYECGSSSGITGQAVYSARKKYDWKEQLVELLRPNRFFEQESGIHELSVCNWCSNLPFLWYRIIKMRFIMLSVASRISIHGK